MSLCKLCLNMWGWQERWGPLRKGSEGRWARRREAWKGKMSSQYWLLGEFFLACNVDFIHLSLLQKKIIQTIHLFKTQIWCQDDRNVIFDDQQMAKNGIELGDQCRRKKGWQTEVASPSDEEFCNNGSRRKCPSKYERKCLV